MYFSCEFLVLKIFGFGDGSEDINGEVGEVLYVFYFLMVCVGFVFFEMWDFKSCKWGQVYS